MRRMRLAVFDCDGTLVDSQAMIVDIINRAFAAEGHPAPADLAVRRTIGLPLAQAMAMLAPGVDAIGINRLTTAYRDISRSIQDRHEPLFDGTRETLDRLARAGWMLAVATGKSRRGLIGTLTRHDLLERFLSLHTADDGPGKPDPTILRNAMEFAGATPEDTVMIGDTSFDMRMAANAGVRGFGVAWGYHPREELMASGAHIVADTYAHLSELLLAEPA
ncbi:MAG: HAD-IA family hydrolase [Alphaproteobacteria bacterium]|nr:HAD-IA family hydrolase [Alphaproteobacteria bacterium]